MTRLSSVSVMSTTVEPMSISLRRTKLRPEGARNTTFNARRAASRTPVVPYSATTTLITSAVAAVPLACSAARSELSSGTTTDLGATSRA